MLSIQTLPTIAALLLTLLAQSVSAQSTSVEPAVVPTVLTGGLGISFEATKEAIASMGFKADDAIARPGSYSRFDPASSFPQQFVGFTALTNRLYSITGVKFYKIENGITDVAIACLQGMNLTTDTIKEKYPALVAVHSNFASAGSKEFCETKASSLVFGKRQETGHQRCVHVSCESSNSELARLTVGYTDQKLLRLSWVESKAFAEKNIEQRRQKAGIKKDEL